MSRSRRKTPIFGITTASSDAEWKARAARKLRRRARALLRTRLEEFPLIGKRWEIVNPWSSEKDGKRWFGEPDPAWLRK